MKKRRDLSQDVEGLVFEMKKTTSQERAKRKDEIKNYWDNLVKKKAS